MESRPLSDSQEFWSACLQSRLAQLQIASSRGNPDAIVLAFQAIDDELAALHLTMCALRTHRNSIPPVSRLPSEVLAQVFLSCAEIFPPSMDKQLPLPEKLGWLKVTHVCKDWRDTALHYPHVWTKICHGLSTPWLKAVLARGRSAPISVTFDYYNDPAPFDKEEVFKHWSRIRDIYLEVYDMPIMKRIIPPILSSPANVLQSLALIYESDATLCLPRHVFQDHGPALRSVTLKNVYIPWSAPILRNLTALNVHFFRGFDRLDREFLTGTSDDLDISAMPPMDALLDCLRGMSSLQTLVLKKCVPPRSRHSTEENIVDLPCLKSLCLRDDIRCLDVLKRPIIPSSCNMDLDVHGENKNSQLLRELDSLFFAHVTRETSPLQSLTLKIDAALFVARILRTGSNGKTKITYTRMPTFPLRDEPPPDPDLPDIAAAWCHRLPIKSSICNLSIKIYLSRSYRTPQDWINTLGKFEAAEQVRILGGGPQTLAFCTTLAMCIPQVTAGEETLFLPNLRHLTINGAILRHLSGLEMQRTVEETLPKQLEARQQIKAIEKVCILWLDPEAHFVAEIERIIPKVVWLEHNFDWDSGDPNSSD